MTGHPFFKSFYFEVTKLGIKHSMPQCVHGLFWGWNVPVMCCFCLTACCFFGPRSVQLPMLFHILVLRSMVSPHSNCWFLSVISTSSLLPTWLLMRWYVFLEILKHQKHFGEKTLLQSTSWWKHPSFASFQWFFPFFFQKTCVTKSW